MAREDVDAVLEEGQRALDEEFARQHKSHAKERAKEERDEDRDEAVGAEGYARGGLVKGVGGKQLLISDDFSRHRGPLVKARMSR